jgi:hypothetical protein
MHTIWRAFRYFVFYFFSLCTGIDACGARFIHAIFFQSADLISRRLIQ